MVAQKVVLFFPLNSPGHINSSLGIADKLKRDHAELKCVFLVLGDTIGTAIQDHGHELVQLEEVGDGYVEYEPLEGEDPASLASEPAELERLGRNKRVYRGALKWPQLIKKNMELFKLPRLEALVESFKIMESLMVDELEKNHDNYSRAIQEIKPDLVIVDAYFIPPCVLKLDVPWARLYSANPLSIMEPSRKLADGFSRPPQFMGVSLLKDKAARERMRREEPDKWLEINKQWRFIINTIIEATKDGLPRLPQFMAKHNCPPVPPGKQAHDSPHLNLYMFPKEIDYDKDDDLLEFPKRWLRCDSLVRQSNKKLQEDAIWSEKIKQASKGKEAVVFFSLGSIASGDVSLMKRYIDMLRMDQSRLYIVSKGVNGDQYKLDDGNMIGGNYIPQTVVLKHVDLAIIHGGNNTITECLYFGAPMIVLPIFADQLDNAQRVEDLELGCWLDVHKCSWDELKSAIDITIKRKDLSAKLRKISSEMKSRDDLQKVSFILKRLLDDGHLDESVIEEWKNKDFDSNTCGRQS